MGSDLEKPNPAAYDQNCILIWGIPVVGPERYEKLKTVLGKLFVFSKSPVSTMYPTDENGQTKGYCFVEYPDPVSANEACKILDGHQFDKKHCFSAYILSQMRELVKPSEEWEEPAPNKYVDVGDLWWWLQNNKCIDQFAIQDETRDGSKLQVYWNSKGQEPTLISAADRNVCFC